MTPAHPVVPCHRLSLKFLGAAAALAIAGAFAAVASGIGAQTPTPNPLPTRPNVVLLMADDLSVAVMDYASNATRSDGSWLMPNFRRYIRAKSVEFRQALSPNPVCCPARATVLTGQYSHNHGTLTNVGRNGTALNMRDGSDSDGDGVGEGDTIALALQRAGYRTGHVGKYLNGYGSLLSTPRGVEREDMYRQVVRRFGPSRARIVLPVTPETGQSYVPPGWTEWYASLDPTTYCTYNTVFSVDGKPRLFHSGGQVLDPDSLPDPLPRGGIANYQTDVIRELSLRFLDRQAAFPEPLFLSVSTLTPHVEVCDWSYARLNDVGPLSPASLHPFAGNINPVEAGGQGYQGLFSMGVRPALAELGEAERFRQMSASFLLNVPSFDEADLSDKPSFIGTKSGPLQTPFLDSPNGVEGDRYPYVMNSDIVPSPPGTFNWDMSTTTPQQQVINQFAQMILSMAAFDRMIGAIAERLEAQGRLANTVFIVTSDNGYLHGQHRLAAKLLAYEESIRVPLYVSLPSITEGPLRAWGMALLNDLTPTLLDLAGIAGSPDDLRITPDGTSLKPLLQTPGYPWRKQALIEHFLGIWADEPFSVDDHPTLFAVRTSHNNGVVPNRLYVEYFAGSQYPAAEGPNGWAAGFYRADCRPEADPATVRCPPGTLHRVPIRPFAYTAAEDSPDRLPEREYYNLDLDRFQLSNGFGAGVPRAISDLAAAESSTLRCRLAALAHCAGAACQAAEWATSCP